MQTRFKAILGTVFAASTVLVTSGSPAKAAACADSTLAVLLTAGSCTDALNNTFVLNSYLGFNSTDVFAFQSAGTTFQYSLQGSSAWPVNSAPGFQLNYTLTAPSGKQFNFYTSNLSSSNDPNNDAGSYSIASATQPSADATFVPPLVANGGLKFYTPKLTTDTFTSTLFVTGGTIASVTGAVALQDIPSTSGVPGPLPILGAGAAFGFSRRVRSRIKTAV